MQRPGAFDILGPPLEEELKKRVGKRRSPLYDMLRYQMGWIDEMRTALLHGSAERVHGIACLVAAQACGAPPAVALPAASGLELAEASVTIHEDLRLGSPNRGDRPALWWVWGHSQGINAGDGVYALARLALMDLSAAGVPPARVLQATRLLDEACLEVCEGQHRDIDLEARGGLTVQAYEHVVEAESGALLGAATAIGALVASAPEDMVEALRTFGRHTGVALRIRREIGTLWGGPGALNGSRILDALDKRRSLPLLYALECAGAAERRTLESLTAREKPVEDREIQGLLDLLDRSGARRLAEQAVEARLAAALRALPRQAMPPAATAELEVIARYLAQTPR